MITLYEYTSQPRYWIAHDEDGYWLVPARDDGWRERTPFVGHALNLRRLPSFDGIQLGLPHGVASNPPAHAKSSQRGLMEYLHRLCKREERST